MAGEPITNVWAGTGRCGEEVLERGSDRYHLADRCPQPQRPQLADVVLGRARGVVGDERDRLLGRAQRRERLARARRQRRRRPRRCRRGRAGRGRSRRSEMRGTSAGRVVRWARRASERRRGCLIIAAARTHRATVTLDERSRDRTDRLAAEHRTNVRASQADLTPSCKLSDHGYCTQRRSDLLTTSNRPQFDPRGHDAPFDKAKLKQL